MYSKECILQDGESGSHYQQQLSEEAKKIDATRKSLNYEKSKEKCKKEMQVHLLKFEAKFVDMYSELEGKGIQNLRNDIKKMKTEYHEKELGPARDDVYKDFEKAEVRVVQVE
jgi:hypothetical protein